MDKTIRNQIVDSLISDKTDEIVHASMTDTLEEILLDGFPGYNNFSDEALCDSTENIQEETLEKLHKKIGETFIEANQHPKPFDH